MTYREKAISRIYQAQRHRANASISEAQAKRVAQRAEKGITSTRPGSLFATGKSLILQIRSPVATMINPPAQEKSPIISGVIICRIKTASAVPVSLFRKASGNLKVVMRITQPGVILE
ncbi:hypothetical protein BBB57_18945 [Kosakonia sacchari]|nr:hypothetical protein BBB57_18945 [Kosakonia sacchari]